MSARASAASGSERGRPANGAAEHRRRPVDADEGRPGPRERQRETARSASKLEHQTASATGEVAPEGHVAPTLRSRVLPVVERRVLVPSLPTLGVSTTFFRPFAPYRSRGGRGHGFVARALRRAL